MFGFALYDRKEKIYLCRDRLGIKPIYWTLIKNNEFVFSSELKPLILHPLVSKKINHNTISNFLRHGYIPAPFSIYDNVFKLEPGKILEISKKDFNPKIQSFWNLQDIIKERKFDKKE